MKFNTFRLRTESQQDKNQQILIDILSINQTCQKFKQSM